MAVKTKETKTENLSEKFNSLLKGTFTFIVLEKMYKELAVPLRAEIKEYLFDNKDGFDVDLSSSVKTEYGSVLIKSVKQYEVDKDKLIELVESGTISIATLVSELVNNKNGGIILKIGGKAAVVELDPQKQLTLTPSAEFKSSIESSLEEETEEEIIEVAKEEPQETDTEASLKKIKAAAKKKSKKKSKKVTKKTSAEDDLNSILEG